MHGLNMKRRIFYLRSANGRSRVVSLSSPNIPLLSVDPVQPWMGEGGVFFGRVLNGNEL